MALITNTLGIMFVRMNSSSLTPGSSSIGDWLSQQRAAQLMSMVVETIHGSGGIVTKSLSDSVIATFPAANSALKAATAIQEATLDNEGADDSPRTTGGPQIDLSVALHFGQLVVAAGYISGNVVDEVVALASQSGSGQILATGTLVAALRGDPKNSVKSLKAQAMTLAAKSMDVYDVPWGPPRASSAKAVPAAAPAAAPAAEPSIRGRTLQLRYDRKLLHLVESSPALTMGRSPESGLMVKSANVARTHAIIEYRDGAFYLVNQSPNGSCIKAQGGAEELCTERFKLQGKGVIGLGPVFARCDPHFIEYRLLYRGS